MHDREKTRLLIVDDDVACARAIASLAEDAGYEVAVADDGAAALEMAERVVSDAVVTDLQMPGLNGNDLLRALKQRDPALPVIVMTAHAEVPSAVEAMQCGAEDFVVKPVDWSVLEQTLEHALERRALMADRVALSTALRERLGLGLRGLVGTSDAMNEVFTRARQVAASRATVLITGESGTGKGELAKAIHDLGPRRDGPFVTLHCASLTETLVESELFGHERGSFTGAHEQHIGRFEHASGGTLFIDEVAEIPAITQTKLLRVLQDRVFERVGGGDVIAVDVRLLAATNCDLAERVRQGRFREDLFYRLNVVQIRMPPLRDRDGDILLLAQHFAERSAVANGKPVRSFSDAARDKLVEHIWPGNVRELQNAVEHAVVMSRGPEIEPFDLPDLVGQLPRITIPGATMREIELEAIRATYHATGGSTRRTAEMLGMSQRKVQYRLRELGLSKSRGRPPKVTDKAS